MYIFLILAIVLLIAALSFFIYNVCENDCVGKPTIPLFAGCLLFFALFACSTKVDSAEVGIKFKKFSVTKQGDVEATRCSGIVFYNPITTDIFTYPTKVLEDDYEEFKVNTKDGAEFVMDPYISFYVDKNHAVDIFKTYRDNIEYIESHFMKTAVYDAFRIVANKYTSDGLMDSREKFEDEVTALLEKNLSTEGFIVKQFTTKIEPPQSLRNMIDSKNAAVQAALKAKNEKVKAEAEASIAIVKANADASVKIAKSEGEAKARKIEADAEAYYNNKLSASLTEMIIKNKIAERWNGEQPQTIVGSSGAGVLLNLAK